MLMNIFSTLPRTSAIYLHRPLLVLGPQIQNHNLKTSITTKFTFLFFLFSLFGFDHGITLSITRILVVPCRPTCEFITNGDQSFRTVITYPPDQLIRGDKLFCDTCLVPNK